MPKIDVKPVSKSYDYDSKNAKSLHLQETLDVFKTGNTDENIERRENSVKSVWEGFREGSSLHGIQHINFRHRIRGVIWTLALTLMICVLLVTLYDLKTAYFSYPTITSITLDVGKELPFPAVTVCNLSPYNKSKLNPDAALNNYYLKLTNLAMFLPQINFSDPAYAQLTHDGVKGYLENNSFSLSSMITFCMFKAVLITCSDILKPHLTDWGICFTFNDHTLTSPIKTKHTGSVTALTMYMKVDQANYIFGENMAAGMKIVLHNPDEKPNVRDNGFLASPGFSTYAAVRMIKYKYLGQPYKAFGDTLCEDTRSNDFKNPLKYHSNYSLFACMSECKQEYIFKRCNCSSYFDNGDERICSGQEYMECYKPTRDRFDIDIDGQNNCSCPLPCEETEYETQISSTYFPSDINSIVLQSLGYTDIRKDYLEVRVFYDSLRYATVEQIPKYTMGDIVAILGGQLGIFIGASFLTLTEIMEFVLCAIIILVKRKCFRRDTE